MNSAVQQNISPPEGGYETVETKAKTLAKGLQEAADKAGVKVAINQSASLLTVFFTEDVVCSCHKHLPADLRR